MRFDLQPVEPLQNRWALTPAAHTTSSEAMKEPSASSSPSAVTSFTLAPVRTSTPISSSNRWVALDMRSGNPGRMRGARLDQDDADISLRVDAVEPVGDHFADRTIEFGGQFRTGRAGADDRDVKLAWTYRLHLGLCAQAGVKQDDD